LPKVATKLNSGATRDLNPGPRAQIPSALTTEPLSHTSCPDVILTFDLFELKIGTPRTPALGNIHTSFVVFYAFFLVRSPIQGRQTDRQTDRQTGITCNVAS